MNFIREFLAISFFVAGVLLCIVLFFDRFQWITLIFAVLSFIIAYVIWPSKKKGQREESNWFLDIMELMIQLPVDICFWTFRMIGHLFRKGDGPDIDF